MSLATALKGAVADARPAGRRRRQRLGTTSEAVRAALEAHIDPTLP